MVSQLWTQVRRFLERESRELEGMRAEFGSQVIDKFDAVVLRDLLFDARRRDEGAGPTGKRYRVMINLTFNLPNPEQWPPTRKLDRREEAAQNLKRRNQEVIGPFAATVAETGGIVEREIWLSCSLIVTVTREQLLDLARRDEVKGVQHLKDMPALLLDTSRPFIGAALVESELRIIGTSVTVAVVDTGIDFGHTYLTPTKGDQRDFTSEGLGDEVGHGTFCAGIVGSQDGTFRGVAPGVQLNDYKIMGLDHLLSAQVAVTALQTVVEKKMHIVNCSWGFSHADGKWKCKLGDCVICRAVDAAVALGCVVVVGAGNEGETISPKSDTNIRCPGNAQGAITVGASDESGLLLADTSAGPTPDRRLKPDLVAPGDRVLSPKAGTSEDLVTLSGTSVACAHVTGVCALLLEANATLNPTQVKGALTDKRNVVDLRLNPNLMGAGRVNAKAAVDAVRAQSRPAAPRRRRHG